MKLIEDHYLENRRKLLKRLKFRAGTEWDAEDVLQDAYERALKYIHSFSGDDIGPWFNTILNNALREHMNASKGFVTQPFEEEEEEGVPCNHYSDQVTKEIYKMISQKSEDQEEILLLYFQNDYKAIDISRITNHPYKTAHQTISRFKDELRRIYG